MYILMGTRPDFYFSIDYFSKFQDSATDATLLIISYILNIKVVILRERHIPILIMIQ